MDWLSLWHGVIGFWQYMFFPDGQPWYTGAFWSNQTQWTVVTVPSILFAFWRLEKKNKKRHEDLKQHITETHNNG